MKCNHVHKDAPDNSICEDCYKLAMDFKRKFQLKMKGGQDDNKND